MPTDTREGTAYFYENGGFGTLPGAREGQTYLYDNVGVVLTDARKGQAYFDDNVGINGADPKEGYAYIYEGDVDTSTPTPHIWFLIPTSGREGDGFKIVGHGFGDSQAALNGIATLADLGLTVVIWQKINGTGHALDAQRTIDPLVPTADPEHQEIDVVVPVGAVSGEVVVETNA